MKTFGLAAVALVLCVSAQAAFSFSEIPWQASLSTVSEKLKTAGFKQIRKDKEGDLTFRGTMLGHDAAGMAFLAQGRLVRVTVMLSTPDEMSRDAYSEVRSALVKRYGPPVTTTRSFLEPFHEGDGYEAEAIRSGKAVFLSRWSENGEELIVSISSSTGVAVTYESAGWPAERDRRKNRGAAAF